MKKNLLGIAILSIFLPASLSAYQTQGFERWTEQGGISFSCKTQCFIDLGMKGTNNLFQISGVEWGGNIIIWTLNNGQLIPLATSNVKKSRAKLFVESYGGQKLPEQISLVMLIDGSMTATNGSIDVMKANGIDKIKAGWNTFWLMDTFKPYTINLLQWAQWNGSSVVKVFSIIFPFLIVFFYFRNKKSFKKNIFISGLLLRWILEIRMGMEWIKYYVTDYKTFISKEYPHKIFRDRWDFYSFAHMIEETLKSEWISTWSIINFQSPNPRPFPGTLIYMLYPYRIIHNYTGSSQAASIYYQSKPDITNTSMKTIKFSDTAYLVINNK